jgi:Pyridoxamine 5'-phosphate oxidase
MSQVLGNELTPELLSRLDGREVESHEGKIIPIFTVDESGWPHPALLSYYEMVAKNQRTIDMALWKDSSTAKNLRQTGKVTLMISDHALNYYIKGTVTQTEAEMSGTPAVSRFRLTVEQVIEDQEPNAEITTGLTYRRMSQRDPNDFAAKVFRGLKDK